MNKTLKKYLLTSVIRGNNGSTSRKYLIEYVEEKNLSVLNGGGRGDSLNLVTIRSGKLVDDAWLWCGVE